MKVLHKLDSMVQMHREIVGKHINNTRRMVLILD